MNESRRRAFLGHLPEVLKKCSGRHYAIGAAEEIALCALISSWIDGRNESFTREDCAAFLAQLKPYAPSLFQSWRPDDEPEPLQPKDIDKWKDAFGQLPPNPWECGHENLTEQMFLMKHEPRLGAWLKAAAAAAGYSNIAHQRAEREKRQRLREVTYGADEHAKNPWRFENLTKRHDFHRAHGEEIAAIYRAETAPVTLPWLGQPNVSVMMKMERENPALRS